MVGFYLSFIYRRVTRNFLGQGSFLRIRARERKATQGKNLRVFPLETLTNLILNEKLYPYMTTIRAFFLQIRALFSNFQKRAMEIYPPPSPLVMRLM